MITVALYFPKINTNKSLLHNFIPKIELYLFHFDIHIEQLLMLANCDKFATTKHQQHRSDFSFSNGKFFKYSLTVSYFTYS